MGAADKRNKLDEDIFLCRMTKDGKVLISWRDKQVTVLKGGEAAAFIRKYSDADDKHRQLLMAKATGNFKRGNEKT